MTNILITSMGGSGSLNIVDSLGCFRMPIIMSLGLISIPTNWQVRFGRPLHRPGA